MRGRRESREGERRKRGREGQREWEWPPSVHAVSSGAEEHRY